MSCAMDNMPNGARGDVTAIYDAASMQVNFIGMEIDILLKAASLKSSANHILTSVDETLLSKRIGNDEMNLWTTKSMLLNTAHCAVKYTLSVQIP